MDFSEKTPFPKDSFFRTRFTYILDVEIVLGVLHGKGEPQEGGHFGLMHVFLYFWPILPPTLKPTLDLFLTYFIFGGSFGPFSTSPGLRISCRASGPKRRKHKSAQKVGFPADSRKSAKKCGKPHLSTLFGTLSGIRSFAIVVGLAIVIGPQLSETSDGGLSRDVLMCREMSSHDMTRHRTDDSTCMSGLP